MTDYKTLYYQLFNRVSDIIEEFQKAQQEAEELYVSSEEPLVVLDESHTANGNER